MAGPSTPRRIIRKKTASARTGLSDVTMWRLENLNKFPARLQLSEKAVGYYEDEIDDWIHSRIRAAGRYQGRTFWLGKTAAPAQAEPPDDAQSATSSEPEISDMPPIDSGRLRRGGV